jgi:hypothetical protein
VGEPGFTSDPDDPDTGSDPDDPDTGFSLVGRVQAHHLRASSNPLPPEKDNRKGKRKVQRLRFNQGLPIEIEIITVPTSKETT